MWTYSDSVAHILDWVGSDPSAVETRFAKRAVLDAYRELPNAHRWSYYFATGRLTTVASYSTGTITYTHSTRRVTLASGTWPSWAAQGHIVIDDIPYEVVERTSDSIIVLSVHSNPGDDVAAGTSYTIARDRYPAPLDWAATGSLHNLTSNFDIPYVSPECWLADQREFRSPGTLNCFSVFGDPNYMGSMAFHLSQSPDSIQNLDYLYYRNPRKLQVESYSTGTVTVTADSAVVTGTGTAWNSTHLGSTFRLGTDTSNVPTGPEGTYPYSVERVITTVTSTTSITVDAVFPSSAVGYKYLITDPIDVDEQSMLNLFKRLCEKHASQGRREKSQDAAAAAARAELLIAMGADSRNMARGVMGHSDGPWYMPSLADRRTDA
jgi:hypothetical protein